MNFFEFFGLFFGIAFIASGLGLFVDRWKNFIAHYFLPPERPPWILLLICGYAMLLVVVGYHFMNDISALSLAVCAVLSLGVVKIFFVVRHYGQFRNFVMALFSSERVALFLFALSYIVIGIGFLVLTWSPNLLG